MKKKTLPVLLYVVMAIALLTGCKSKDADDLPQPVITPRQSELLKTMNVMPEDITSVTIQDDHFEEYVLTDPVEWSFLYTYDSVEETLSPSENEEIWNRQMATFFCAPDSQLVTLNIETHKINLFVSGNGEIYAYGNDVKNGPKIFRSSEFPLNTVRWESLIRQHGGTIEKASKKVCGLLRCMRIWPGNIDSIEITDMDNYPDVYVSKVSKDWKFLSTYTTDGEDPTELLPEFLAFPTSWIITMNAGDVKVSLRVLSGGEIMTARWANTKTGNAMQLPFLSFTSSKPFNRKAQIRVLNSAKSQGSPLVEE